MCNFSINWSKGRRNNEEEEKIFEATMAENFLKLMMDTKPLTQESQRIPNRINTNRDITNHILFKL